MPPSVTTKSTQEKPVTEDPASSSWADDALGSHVRAIHSAVVVFTGTARPMT